MMPSTPPSRRDALRIGGAVLALTLTACASLLGPRSVNISEAELLDKLSKRFPMQQRFAGIWEVQTQRPELSMLADSNRVGAKLPVEIRDRLLGQTTRGTVQISFGLRYAAPDQTIRLNDPRVEDIQLQGLPASAQRGLTRLGAWLADDALHDTVVHQFKPEDLRTADSLGYAVKAIRVTRSGLSIDLVPKTTDTR